MQNLIVTIGILLFLSWPADAQRRQNQETTKYSVNIDCQNCVERITQHLAFERGVRNLQFSIEEQTVEITFRTNRTNKDLLADKIKELEFEVTEIKEAKKDSDNTEDTEADDN